MVLFDIKPEFSAAELAVDYLVCADGIKEFLNKGEVMNLKREVHYDVIIIMEKTHWVYALPLGNLNDAPHTRCANDALKSRVMSKV